MLHLDFVRSLRRLDNVFQGRWIGPGGCSSGYPSGGAAVDNNCCDFDEATMFLFEKSWMDGANVENNKEYHHLVFLLRPSNCM